MRQPKTRPWKPLEEAGGSFFNLPCFAQYYLGVEPKIGGNTGTPKWMVKIMAKPYEQMDDLRGYPPIFGNIHFREAVFF